MRSFSTFLTVIMLAVFGTMVLMALPYPAGARFMPLVVGLPGIVFCLLQLLVDWRKSLEPARLAVPAGEPAAVLHGPDLAPHEGEEEIPQGELVRRELVMGAYFLGFIAGLLLLGFWISIPVLLLSFLRFQAKTGWLGALAGAVCATGILYLAFAVILRITLHQGFLVQALRRSWGG